MALPGRHQPRVTTHAPHIRGIWSGDRITAVVMLALLPPLGAALAERGTALLVPLSLSVGLVLFWQAGFAWLRHRPMDRDGIVTALAFALLVPADAAAWQLALAISFGVVVGEQIFGGRGRNFLNPTVVAVAFLIFSFPGSGYEVGSAPPSLAVVPGAVLLLALGQISWRVVVAAIVAFAVVGGLLGEADLLAAATTGAFAFGLIFLAGDPVAAASTNPGRWVYGALVGGLTVLGRTSGVGDGTVFAILIASIFAPLIDQAAVFANVWWRRRRYG